MSENNKATKLGFLRTCIDKRFVLPSREAFEKKTGLGPDDYWHEAYAGGSALPEPNTKGEDHADAHGATIFGWGAHLDNCGGQPGVNDNEIIERLNQRIAVKKEKFPDVQHFRVIASEKGVKVNKV